MKHTVLAESTANGVDFTRRHNSACVNPIGVEVIATMLTGWEIYAVAHKARFESVIDEDYILGPAWIQMGKSFLVLLNGELGRLDARRLDAFIREVATANGFDGNSL